MRAKRAQDDGSFADEIVAVKVSGTGRRSRGRN